MRPRKLGYKETYAAGYRLTHLHFNPFGTYVYVPQPRSAFVTYNNYLVLLETDKYKDAAKKAIKEFAKKVIKKVNKENFQTYARKCPWRGECKTCNFESCPVLNELRQIAAFEKVKSFEKPEGAIPNEPVPEKFEKAEFEVLKNGMHT